MVPEVPGGESSYARLALVLRSCRITSHIRSLRMGMPSDQAADLPERAAQWIAGCAGRTYEVEFKGEQRERLDDRDLVEAGLPQSLGPAGAYTAGSRFWYELWSAGRWIAGSSGRDLVGTENEYQCFARIWD